MASSAEARMREPEQTVSDSVQAELDVMREAGTLKAFHYINSPMAPAVKMEDAGNVLVLSANNYLGLADHPDVIAAGKKALDTYGAGTASVRFICGTFSIHREIEDALATLHHTDAALTYPSCWQANTGLIPALAGKDDAIISDALNHASLIDGCRMSKAKRFIYAHADMAELEARLKEAQGARRIFVITDGVFSMEGDIAPLPDVLEIAHKYGAAVIVDDCHGVGVMGKHGRGTAEHFGVEGQVDIITGTLGKALGGAAGGYIAGPRFAVETIVQRARPTLFSNALPVSTACSADKAIEILMNEPHRVKALHDNVEYARSAIRAAGFEVLESPTAICPIIVGETAKAISMSKRLLEMGVYVIGFGYPVVPEGEARLRVQISAAHTREHLDELVSALKQL